MENQVKVIDVGEYSYQSSDLIGHGAFAVVYKGKHKSKNFPVAIKVIAKKNLRKSKNILIREINVLGEITQLHHENVVALLGYTETVDHVYLIMEYCNRSDLAEYLHKMGILCEDTIKFFLKQIAEAMKILHSKGIVHRDLKPQNILLCSKKPCPNPQEIILKIADFGFARFLPDGAMAATMCGSPVYMAPEVIMSLKYGAKADLWSIGTIIFQCLTGKAPFSAKTPPALKHFYEQNVDLVPNIPIGTSKPLIDLLNGLLKRDPNDRMDFDEFFNHEFLRNSSAKSKVEVVPSVPSDSSDSSDPSDPSDPSAHTAPAAPTVPTTPTVPKTPPAPSTSSVPSTPSVPLAPSAPSAPKQASPSHCVPPVLPTGSRSPIKSGAKIPAPTTLDDPEFNDFVFVPLTGLDDRLFEKKNSKAMAPKYARIRKVSLVEKPTALHDHLNAFKPSRPVPNKKNICDHILKTYQPSGAVASDSGHPSVSTSGNSNRCISVKAGSSMSSDEKFSLRFDSNSSGSSNTSNRFITDISQLSPPTVQFIIDTPSGLFSGSFTANRRCSAPLLNASNCLTSPMIRKLTPPLQLKDVQTQAELTYIPSLRSPDRTLQHQLTSDALVPRSNSSLMKLTFHESPTGENSGLGHHPYHPHKSRQFRHSFSFGSRSSGHKIVLNDIYKLNNPNALTLPNPSGLSGSQNTYSIYAQFSNRNTTDASLRFIEDFRRFNVQELPEETLLNKEHNETLGRLNFIITLSECIIRLAEHRESLLDLLMESSVTEVIPLNQRKTEKFVLYVRALNFVSSALHLSKTEITSERLSPSSSVRQVLNTLKSMYNKCIENCMALNQDLSIASMNFQDLDKISADSLIYDHAIQMAKSAATEEMLGDMKECIKRYQTAQILLHSLSQQPSLSEEKGFLNRYKDAVEKRLYLLHREGYVIPMDTSATP